MLSKLYATFGIIHFHSAWIPVLQYNTPYLLLIGRCLFGELVFCIKHMPHKFNFLSLLILSFTFACHFFLILDYQIRLSAVFELVCSKESHFNCDNSGLHVNVAEILTENALDTCLSAKFDQYTRESGPTFPTNSLLWELIFRQLILLVRVMSTPRWCSRVRCFMISKQ